MSERALLSPVLNDAQWLSVKQALPQKIVGSLRSERALRGFVEGGLLVMLGGCYWAALPVQPYGAWRNNHARHDRWIEAGWWLRVADALGADAADRAQIERHCRRRLEQKRRVAERRRSRLLYGNSAS